MWTWEDRQWIPFPSRGTLPPASLVQATLTAALNQAADVLEVVSALGRLEGGEAA